MPIDWGIWFADFVKANGVATAILVFVAIAFWKLLWPFYENKYYPDQRKKEDADRTILQTLTTALIKLETLEGQSFTMLQQVLKVVEETNSEVKQLKPENAAILSGINDLRARPIPAGMPIPQVPQLPEKPKRERKPRKPKAEVGVNGKGGNPGAATAAV
jgi:hypothetical protein